MAAAITGFLAFTSSAQAQYWTMTGSPVTNWGPIACSADSSQVIAGVGASRSYPHATGPIYISSDRGGTWTPTSAPMNGWTGLASSADGNTLLACPYSGVPYFSTDAGNTWTAAPLPATNWMAVACSANGTRMLAAASSVYEVYESTNSGLSWMNVSLPSTSCMALSANGRLLVVGESPGNVDTFTNYAATSWVLRSIGPETNWVAVACSADGKNLVAGASPALLFVPSPGEIFTSQDYGTSWRATESPGTGWRAVASSADGTQLAAISTRPTFPATSGTIFISTNSGANWSNTLGPTLNWQQIASSADGNLKWATCTGGPICYLQTTPAPVLNIAASADTVTISWIIPSANFALQQSPELTPGNWSDVSVLPTLDYDKLEYKVSLPLTPGPVFYRLIRK